MDKVVRNRFRRIVVAILGGLLLLLLGVLPARAADIEGSVQAAGRDFVRVSSHLVRLNRGTLLEDMAGNVLGLEELKPGVWVKVDINQENGSAERIRALVVR